MVDRLAEYGYSFQIKLIASLLSDQGFLQQILELLDVDFFESEANQEIIKIIKDYFENYRQIPTLEVLKVKFTSIESDVLKTAMIEHLKDIWRNLEASDLPFVKEETLKFCKNQKLKGAILDSVELLNAGDYDAIKAKIDDAMRAGAEQRIGHNYLIDIRSRYEAAARVCVPTRWPIINEIMDGGLSRGELGIIIGGPGAGKCIGPNSHLKIAYDEFAIPVEINGVIEDMWISPFDKIKLRDDLVLFGWEVKLLIEHNR